MHVGKHDETQESNLDRVKKNVPCPKIAKEHSVTLFGGLGIRGKSRVTRLKAWKGAQVQRMHVQARGRARAHTCMHARRKTSGAHEQEHGRTVTSAGARTVTSAGARTGGTMKPSVWAHGRVTGLLFTRESDLHPK
ncbi:hypothetical protein CRG98_021385 [Punica granatum]|uniref:Uncharacterized protein n=1 Tax=Punica granatum TaxID=22663 RepID=A0A2I0JPJ3_PUNGR|nr:hypothetical protein CRG98_021385 [Punica granatum]